MTREEIIALIRARAQAAGIDPNHALAMASIESRFDPNAVNPAGTHKGLYQFGPNEWKQWGGGGDIFDPNAQMAAFQGYHGNIKDQLAQTLGRQPTPQEMYLGWQQGAAGAGKLITNPLTSAPAMIGNAAFDANRGQSGQNSQQFVNQWSDTYNKHLKEVGGIAQPPPPAGSGLLAPAGIDPAPGVKIEDEIADWSKYGDKDSNNYAAGGAALAKVGMDMARFAPSASGQQLQASMHQPKELVALPNFTQQLAQSRLKRKPWGVE